MEADRRCEATAKLSLKDFSGCQVEETQRRLADLLAAQTPKITLGRLPMRMARVQLAKLRPAALRWTS